MHSGVGGPSIMQTLIRLVLRAPAGHEYLLNCSNRPIALLIAFLTPDQLALYTMLCKKLTVCMY